MVRLLWGVVSQYCLDEGGVSPLCNVQRGAGRAG